MTPRHRQQTGGWQALFLSLCFAHPLPAATLTLASPAAFPDALTQVMPGDTLLLPPGDYGSLVLHDSAGRPEAPITLRAADPARPPRFSGMILRDADHLVLDGLVFDYSFSPGDTLGLRPFQIVGSRDIALRRLLFDGDVARNMSPVDDGFGTASGLFIADVDRLILQGSELRGFFLGIAVTTSRDVILRGNDLHAMRSDGIDLSAVQRVLIEGNTIRDFKRSLGSADHADMIQFWTTGTTAPSRDVTILGNVLNSGHGPFTQSIFMRNEQVDSGAAGREMFYQNVTIDQNVIINAHLHGITVGETSGLMIRNNTLLRNPRSAGAKDNPDLWTPQIQVARRSTDVRILRNVVARISGPEAPADWRVADNYLVQDRSTRRHGFYDLLFEDARHGDPANLASFAYRVDGPLHKAGLGAARLDPP